MWKKLSIGKKILFSICLLFVGYLISMAIGFFSGNMLKNQLVHVSDSLFPASQKSKEALTDFKEQLKLYEDGMLLGETGTILSAKQKSRDVLAALKAIQSLDGVDKQTVQQMDTLISRIDDFTEKAEPAYVAFSEGSSDESVAHEVKKLADDQKGISQDLEKTVATFSNSLKTMLGQSRKAISRQQAMNIVLFIIVVTVSSILGSMILSRSVLMPLSKTVTMVKGIAQGEGDLTRRLNVTSEDEVGDLSKWFNMFVENLQEMISQIADNAGSLNESSGQLNSLSGMMSKSSEEISQRSQTASSASDELRNNMDSISTSMEEASGSTLAVAEATEQMTSTIQEISGNSEKARSITDKAVSQVDKATRRVKGLGAAANDIGKVTETINDISDQTNLLALNATIEAARAGEAGKGFAVVANEIKELARQTAQATQDIKAKIQGIQDSTLGTVSDIDEISSVISQVNEIVSTIAVAVEEQTSTTQNIADNVGRVAHVIQDINHNVGRCSSFSSQIAEDMNEFNTITATMSGHCVNMDKSANTLESLAKALSNRVGRFKV